MRACSVLQCTNQVSSHMAHMRCKHCLGMQHYQPHDQCIQCHTPGKNSVQCYLSFLPIMGRQRDILTANQACTIYCDTCFSGNPNCIKCVSFSCCYPCWGEPCNVYIYPGKLSSQQSQQISIADQPSEESSDESSKEEQAAQFATLGNLVPPSYLPAPEGCVRRIHEELISSAHALIRAAPIQGLPWASIKNLYKLEMDHYWSALAQPSILLLQERVRLFALQLSRQRNMARYNSCTDQTLFF